MRRKNDKRVLIHPRDRKFSKNNNERNFINRKNQRMLPNNMQKKSGGGKAMWFVIIAIVAFVIGAGIGVSMSISDDTPENTTNVENVTVEMTTNLNESDNQIVYDVETDNVDFNDNETLTMLNLTNQSESNQSYY